MKDNKEMKCDPCEQDFKKKVNELVKEGKAPTHADRAKREHEIKSVFGEHKHPMDKPTEHPTPKQHEMAGMAKMKK